MPEWRKVLAIGLLFCSAGALAHDPEKPNRHADRWQHYEGTQTCLECHEEEAMTFFHSRHYQWRGGAPDPDEARAAVDVPGSVRTVGVIDRSGPKNAGQAVCWREIECVGR